MHNFLTILDKIKSLDSDAEVHFFQHTDIPVISVGLTKLILKLHEKETIFHASPWQLQVLKNKWYLKYVASIVCMDILVSDFNEKLTSTDSCENNA